MTPTFTNTAWVHAREGALLRGGRWKRRIALPVRVGLLERPEGIVLIDAGYSPEALSAPGRSLALRSYARAFAPDLLPEGDPEAVLSGLGLSAQDVVAVIVTHFHVDHVSALLRFPDARIITHGPALAEVLSARTVNNLRQGIFPELLPTDIPDRLDDITRKPRVEAPLGLGAAHDVFGDGTVLGIDLPGHAAGHFGLCFPQGERPLLYAVDTQWLLASLPDRAPGFPASLIGISGRDIASSTAKIARFAAAGGEVMLCHDPIRTAYDIWSDG
jgi:glyoxylase-like metal-dependent hydrolase (beta-lactamase superfamily II)